MRNENLVVRKHRNNVPHLVGFAANLPTDLAPLLILDASARIRHTYALWEKERGSLVRLKTAAKDYSKLKVHWWNKGGGRSSIEKTPNIYASAIGDIINASPDANWLVIYHKPTGTLNLQNQIKNAFNEKRSQPEVKVRFLSWGNHTATNDYKDADHIILAGTLFLPDMEYEARTNAASGKTSTGHRNDKLIAPTKLGEHLHGVLQAACRGSVRHMTDGMANACEVYLIADSRHGIANHIQHVFPGCQTEEWIPEPPRLPPKALELVKCLISFFDKTPLAFYPFTAIKKKLSIKSVQQLTALRGHPALLARLQELEIEEFRPAIRATCYRKIPQVTEAATAL